MLTCFLINQLVYSILIVLQKKRRADRMSEHLCINKFNSQLCLVLIQVIINTYR
jgi:hypothetical protein